jgi:hypothetical protein
VQVGVLPGSGGGQVFVPGPVGLVGGGVVVLCDVECEVDGCVLVEWLVVWVAECVGVDELWVGDGVYAGGTYWLVDDECVPAGVVAAVVDVTADVEPAVRSE